ncbi:unnamed protein product [Didymodactylos carnosus]|uniref:Receptor expression-enhancing protein n=1 Tax=Didymodactylos carnosus TaxID=1234261 RepID=A0A814RF06_9BILA|nr:unnamed protein product [Didymodactylos carnosus]CAF3895267.1 unnamed protein product [Didymodactylos carnosus]
MEALVRENIRKLEVKLKPLLHEGPLAPYLNTLEQKTKVKREQLALGFFGIVCIYLMLGSAADFVCNFLGFVYPAYASVIAIESPQHQDDTEWLIYWVVYGTFGFAEYFGHHFFHSLWLYWLLKCGFLVWLMVPGQKGGSFVLYHRFIRSFVLKHRPVVEKYMKVDMRYEQIQHLRWEGRKF